MKKSIAIIGGGPGGLFAAIWGAKRGLNVDLYEKGKIGSGIRCAEGFIDTLGNLGEPETGILFKVENVIFFAGQEHHLQLSKEHGIWMIDRSTWQKSLATKAQELGVSINEDFPIGKDRLKEMQDVYHYIIDASGAPSVTSRLYGFVPDYLKNATLLAQYRIEGDFSYLGKNTIKAGYERHYSGYYYIFPKGQTSANVGIGKFHVNKKGRMPKLKIELDRVLRKEGLDSYAIQDNISSFTPSCSVKRLLWQNIILIGDAAALCSPLHGGGIDMACTSGRIAVELIASDSVSQYPARLWGMVGKKLTMEMRVTKLWQFLGYSFVTRALRHPGLLKGIIFNKRPYPQFLGYGGKKIFSTHHRTLRSKVRY
jgi:digeranylgeranylglycerophospholipid reductase